MAALMKGAACAKAIRSGIEASVEVLRAQKMQPGLGILRIGEREDDIAYEIEIERSEEMEQEIDHSINQMNDEFRMTRTAAELTDLQGKEE